MKKTLLFLFFPYLAFAAQAPIFMVPPGATMTPPTAKKEAVGAAVAASTKSSKEIMIISPEMRANDIKSAIKYLTQRVPTSKPSVLLTNGSTISGIMDVDVMPGGTILIFKISSLKGVQYKVMNIEDVKSLND